MTKKALAIASVVVLSMAVAAVSARAQAGFVLAANIPFDFVVGKQTLPAGEYRIEQLSGRSVLLIRSTGGHTSTFEMTMAARANDWQSESKLVFNWPGDQIFPSQIWTPGNQSVQLLYKSSS